MDTRTRIMELAAYFNDVRPHHEYLAEHLASADRKEFEAVIKNHTNSVSMGLDLDPIFLKEAMDYLSMAISNLLAYKQLMGAGFRSWAWVTLYYSNFYAASCLLQLAGVAAIHVEWVKLSDLQSANRRPERMRLLLQREDGNHSYGFSRPSSSEHQIVFGKLARHFPEMLTEYYGGLIRQDRARENYELRFPSQGLHDHALEDARQIYTHDFAVPGYREGWTPEAAEYLSNIYAGYGYKEDYSAQRVKTCIEAIAESGRASRFRNDFVSYYRFLSEQTQRLDSKPSPLGLVRTWLEEAHASVI